MPEPAERDFLEGLRPEDRDAAIDDLCAHNCGREATVRHADGRMLCRGCYDAEVNDDGTPDCPTCWPVLTSPVSRLVDQVDQLAEDRIKRNAALHRIYKLAEANGFVSLPEVAAILAQHDLGGLAG